MSLRDEVKDENSRHGPKCRLLEEIAKHGAMADEIREIISDRTLSMRAAARVFLAHDIDIQEHALKRHRSNLCMTCRDRGVIW